MDTTKLQAALVELQSQRQILDTAIADIQKVLALLNGHAPVVNAEMVSGAVGDVSEQRSYIDDAVSVYKNEGKPLHVNILVEKMSQIRGVQLRRASVESSIIRHITKANHPLLAKFNAATYGLPAWKQQSDSALHTA